MSPPSSGCPPLFLSLEPILRCPNRRCGKIAYGLSSDLATLTCQKCGAHWWATRIEPGNLRANVLDVFDGNVEFVRLLDELGAPQLIERPMFWQVLLTGNEQHHFTDRSKPGRILDRTHELMRRLLHRKAS